MQPMLQLAFSVADATLLALAELLINQHPPSPSPQGCLSLFSAQLVSVLVIALTQVKGFIVSFQF